MKKLLLYLLLAAIHISMFAQVPIISSFSPAYGPIGSADTIKGTNFSSSLIKNIVYFGGIRATVNYATSTELIVTVPVGANYLPISVTVDSLTSYSSKPFIVTFPGGKNLINAYSFESRIDFSADSKPSSVCMGDLDGDGKPDVVIAEWGSSDTVSVFQNMSYPGKVAFSSKIELISGYSPSSVILGDIDGDGKLDIIVTNASSNSVSIFRNTSTVGHISFNTAINFNTGNSPNSVCIADIDGDGKPDLAVANSTSGSFSVLRNTSKSGKINFATKVDFTSGVYPISITIGDLNADGKPDLAVLDQNGKAVYAYKNVSSLGIISFTSAGSFGTGSYPEFVSMGDLDGDNMPDLAVANSSFQLVSLLRNTSTSGSISFATKVDFTVGLLSEYVGIGDFDGDGKPDLAVLNEGSNSVSILKNKSTIGNFNFNTGLSFNTSKTPYSGAIGDIDGDGRLDFVNVNQVSAGALSVLINRIGIVPYIKSFNPKTGSTSTLVTIIGKYFQSAKAISIGGVSNTSFSIKSDTLIVDTLKCVGNGYVTVTNQYGSDSLPGFTFIGNPIIKSFFPKSGSIGSVITITGKYFNATKSVYFGNTPTTFMVITDSQINVTIQTCSGNSFTIIKPCGKDSVSGFAFITNPDITSFEPKNGMIGSIINIYGKNLSGIKSITFGDTAATFNIISDTLIKAVVGNGRSGMIKIYSPCGKDSINGFVFIYPPVIYSFSPDKGTVGIFDTIFGNNFSSIDSENIVYYGAVKARVIYSSTSKIIVKVPISSTYSYITVTTKGRTAFSTKKFDITFSKGYINNNSFATDLNLTTLPNPDFIVTGDIDNDGKPDLIVLSYDSSKVSVYKNTSISGHFSFANKTDFPCASGPVVIYVSDIDGDGKVDLITLSPNAKLFSIYRNTSTIGNISFAKRVDFSIGSYTHSTTLCIGDFNLDGRPDIAISIAISLTYISIYSNISSIGSVNFSHVLDITMTNFIASNLANGDLDGDGKTDLVWFEQSTGNINVIRNNSNNALFSFNPLSHLTHYKVNVGLDIGDLDGDGKLDLITLTYYNASNDSIKVLLNTSNPGNISYKSLKPIELCLFSHFIILADLDGDGKPDIISSSDSSNVLSVFKNISSPGKVSLSSRVDFFAGHEQCAAAICDFDGDGKPDIATCNYKNNTVSVLRNNMTLISNNVISGNQTLCAFSKPDSLKGLKPTGISNIHYLWISSTKDSTYGFIRVGGIDTLLNYLPLPDGVSRWFRRIALSGSFCDTSNAVTIKISHTTLNFAINDTNQCLKNNLFIFQDNSNCNTGSYSRKWDFGNSITDTSKVSKIIYSSAGNYYVKLKTITKIGCEDSLIKSVSVHPSPVAGSISGQTLNVIYMNPYTYSVIPQSSITYNWVVTNGNIISGQGTNSIMVKWTSIGKCYLKVIISNNYGCPDTSYLNISVTTGIFIKSKYIENMDIYPNPSNGTLTISIDANNDYHSIISFTNTLGEEIWTKKYELKTGNNTYKIVLKVKPGVYFICLTIGNERIFKKEVINN